jgi:hypothetical protein
MDTTGKQGKERRLAKVRNEICKPFIHMTTGVIVSDQQWLI